jgi:pyruvate,water dikinase
LFNSAAYIETVLLLGGVMLREAPVRRACRKVGFPYERLVYPQLAAGERSTSTQQAFDLVDLAAVARREPIVVDYLMGQTGDIAHARAVLRGTAFLADFEDFLRKYGHRGRYKTDWSLPRYDEDPTPLFLALRAHLETGLPIDSGDMIRRLEREAAEAWTAFERHLTPWRRRITVPRLRRAIGTIKRYYIWREQVRSDMVRVLGAVRRWHLALADRFVERGWLDTRDDYFFVEFQEIADVVRGQRDAGTLRTIVADRLAERRRNQAIRMPLVMWESELPALIRTAGVTDGSRAEAELTGDVVSAGCVEADVVVVRDPGDFSRMKRGAILVAPATDPSWTPLFTLASGVIVEVGGVLSHASTIAREYGLPALANVKDATRRLKTGDRVRLDAANGLATRVLPAAAPSRDVALT